MKVREGPVMKKFRGKSIPGRRDSNEKRDSQAGAS